MVVMTQFIIFLIIGLAGILVGYYLAVKKKTGRTNKYMERLHNEKEKNLATLRTKFKNDKDRKITNDEVEKLLGVSDATATRYLETLEQEGAIEQVGKEGRYVYYKAI